MEARPLEGSTVGVTAERRFADQARLLEARGARVVHGATMGLYSTADDDVLRSTTEQLVAAPPDYLVSSTGYGMRTWLAAADGWGLRDALLDALRGARVANRGAKAASANGANGLPEWWRAPNERLDEVVDRLAAEPLAARRVVLQLHGGPHPGSAERLRAAGAEVVEVDPYRLAMPTDPRPARDLVMAAVRGELAAVTFVVAPAVHNLFVVARGEGLEGELRATLNGPTVAACVGPVCAEGARAEGVVDPLVPDRARLVPMIQALTDRLAPVGGSRP